MRERGGSLVVLLLAERAPSEGPRSTRAIEDQPGHPLEETNKFGKIIYISFNACSLGSTRLRFTEALAAAMSTATAEVTASTRMSATPAKMSGTHGWAVAWY